MEKYVPITTAIALPYVGGIVGAFIVKKENIWYETLKRPSWQLPKWMPGPLGTTLYTGMGTASYLVWRDGGGFDGEARLPLMFYGANLALNWFWAPIFFGAHKRGLALADILLLWGSIGACTVTFYNINKTASYLMIPYWAMVSLASAMTYCIWRDNKDKND